MNAPQVRALLDRHTAALRSLLPEAEAYRLLLALAATEALVELQRADAPARSTLH